MRGIKMKRNVKLPKERKQELIEAALKLFCAKGYENTSIRDILNEVGGKVGMFYHYFKSKEEIFELAFEYFLDDYIIDFSEISKNNPKSFRQSIYSLITLQSEVIFRYRDIWADKIHWSMASAMHKKTLERLIPCVEFLITNASESNAIILKKEEANIHDIALFLTYGVSGILHEKPLSQVTQIELIEKKQDVYRLVAQFFDYKE
jgi:AcrR family transcriptional regulator